MQRWVSVTVTLALAVAVAGACSGGGSSTAAFCKRSRAAEKAYGQAANIDKDYAAARQAVRDYDVSEGKFKHTAEEVQYIAVSDRYWRSEIAYVEAIAEGVAAHEQGRPVPTNNDAAAGIAAAKAYGAQTLCP